MGGYHQLPVTPYNPPDPGEGIQRAIQLKSALGQQQVQQQQIQAGQLENQQRQMDLQSQKAVMDAYRQANGDLDKAIPIAAANGAKPDALFKLREASMSMQKQNMELLNAKGAKALSDADLMQGAHDAVAKAPPEQRAAVYQQQLMGLQRAQVDISQAPPQYPGDEAFQMMGLGLKGHKAQLEELAKQAGIQKEQAQAAEATAGTQVKGIEAQQKSRVLAGTNAQGITAEQQAQLGQGAQRVQLERARTAMESRKIALDYMNAGFNSDGSPMTVTNASPTARQIAAGKMDPSTSRAMLRRQPGLYNQVLAVDPTFDETTVERRFGFNKELTNYGVQHIGGQALALNKLVHHSDLLYDLVDGLQNGTFTPGNQLYNSVKTAFGAAPVPKFNIVRDFVAGEAGKLATGGVPNESDLKRSIENMKSAGSPEQLKSAVNQYLAISGGQMQAINEQGRRNGMGDNFTILGPEAKAIVQKHGIDPTTLKQGGAGNGGISVTDPNGGVHSFPNQAAADKFKALAGIK